MHRGLAFLLSLLLLITLPVWSLAAADITGTWGGTISAGEYTFGASVTFSQSGSYSIRAGILSSSGSYRASGNSITLSPSSPPGYNTTTMSLSLSEDGKHLTISGSIKGLRGSLSLNRRIPTATKNPLFARWQHESAEGFITLDLFEGGWVYWQETYEKVANTRLLERIRDGIRDGTLMDTAQVLTLIDSGPPMLEVGGGISLEKGLLSISPLPSSLPVPSLWAAAWQGETSTWQFRANIVKDQLVLGLGTLELVFRRLAETPKLPTQALFIKAVALKAGNEGALVQQLQEQLLALSLLSIPADSVYGARTEEAVRAFEEMHALPQDGQADMALLDLLYRDTVDGSD